MPASERGTRKLAAIMFTDIKSFSRKMSEDEELAMQILRVHDDTLKSIIEKYDGKIIKAIGDAFMVDFSSAVNAVKCAIESQEAFYEYNEGKSELEKIEVRMGIHLGDVITDGNDIFGDGVNIASRIEAVTEPNRICISQDVYSQIKNKMQLKTFHMGSINLKNIAEPVEVYEILLESIPEFSTPSKSAQQMPSKRQVEKVTKREAKEAEHIEASKKKLEEDRQRAEKENQEKVERHYQKAEALAGDGKFDEAEKELIEVFKVVAFHAGAQVLQGRIEERREKKKDEERKHGAAKKKIQQRINELTGEALSMVEQDNFTEAVLKVQEIFRIDPDNNGAKELEEQIRQAQKAKEELERQRSEADVALPAEEEEDTPPKKSETARADQAEPQEEVELEPEPESARKAPPQRRSAGLRQPKKRLPPLVRKLLPLAVAAVLLIVLFPTFERLLVPRDTSIVVAPFEVAGGSDTSSIGAAVASVITGDLSAYPELVVIRPGPLSGRTGKTQPLALAKALEANYVLSAEILSFYPRLVVKASLNAVDIQATLWERTIDSDPFVIAPLRRAIVENVLATMELERPLNEVFPLSSSPLVNMQYLMGEGALLTTGRQEVARAAGLFQQAVALDSTIAQGYIGLGRALLRLYKAEGERDRTYLRDAVDAGLRARNINPSLPGTYEVLGSAYLSAGRYELATSNLTRALELQPGNPECYRQTALLAVVRGDYDQALTHGSKALYLDPRNPDTHEIMGHVHYFKQQYNSALNAYDKAVGMGTSDYFITTRYKMAVWGAGLSPEPVAEFGKRLLREDSTNYVVNYWIGRAYMLSGFWLQAKGYLETGAEHLKGVLERNPSDAFAHGYMALYRARLGESAAGLEHADKSVELSGESAVSLYRKAQFFAIQTEKKEEALEWLQKAVSREFILTEVMNPDFAFISKESGFRQAVSVKVGAN